MKNTLIFILSNFLIIACQPDKNNTDGQLLSTKDKTTSRDFHQIVIEEDNLTTTVDIKSYTLITDNVDAHRTDAKEIMQVKRNWPMAMQTKDRALFDKILSKKFTFRAPHEFFNREDYILDRTQSPVIVENASYENLVLQFFDEMAVLTYRNIIKGKDKDGIDESWQYSWADIYVKEDGMWKIGASHLIQERKE